MHKKTSAPLAPWPRHHYLKTQGVGGLGGVAYKDRARPPPCAYKLVDQQNKEALQQREDIIPRVDLYTNSLNSTALLYLHPTKQLRLIPLGETGGILG